MNERETFLKKLGENEDEIMTRLVYADWLDEQGEHEEADRQRKWRAAKGWLVQFAKESSGFEEVSYEGLLEFGRKVVQDESTSGRIYIDNEAMWDGLKAQSREFWENWSVVTGIPLPRSLGTKDFHHWACCAHEVYYWFGSPDESSDSE